MIKGMTNAKRDRFKQMDKGLLGLPLLSTLALSTLLLFSSCSTGRYNESTGQYVDNTAVTAKVKTKLLDSKEVSGTSINVESYKGTVILSGFIDKEEEKVRAIELAKEVKGVESVKTQLVLRKELF